MRKTKVKKVVKSLGDLIRNARDKAKLTLLDLAKRIKTGKGKLNESYLSRIESGKKIPSMDVVEQLIDELDLDRDEVLKLYDFKVLKATYTPSKATVSLSNEGNIIITRKKPKKNK
tara:strand:+ start:172 stop:519 length:348 start_codon:yes stop_codon:yes gene_type:complete